MPSKGMPYCWILPRVTDITSDNRAKLPPSPRLSARMMMVTYFNVTRTITDQKTSERMPRTWSGSAGME